MNEQPASEESISLNPELVIQGLKLQLAEKASEAANNWAGMQQINQQLQAVKSELKQAKIELEELRLTLNQEQPFVPDEQPVLARVDDVREPLSEIG